MVDIESIKKLSLKLGDIVVITLSKEPQSGFATDNKIRDLATSLAEGIDNIIIVPPENVNIDGYTKEDALKLLNDQKISIERIIDSLTKDTSKAQSPSQHNSS